MPDQRIRRSRSQSQPLRPDRLCSTCQTVDFERLLTKHINYKLKRYISTGYKILDSWATIRQRDSCSFCRLVTASILTLPREQRPDASSKMELSNKKSWKLCISGFSFRDTAWRSYSNRWELEEQAKITQEKKGYEAHRILVSWHGCDNVGEIQYLADHEGMENSRFFGRNVAPRGPNWPLFRRWVKSCETFHGDVCKRPEKGRSARKLPKNLRVIDTKKMLIVPHPPGEEYVALTYVWGQDEMEMTMPTTKIEDVRASQGLEGILLPRRLPRTIADSIEATSRLGFRYLWVDSLCIVQDDDADRHGQLLKMDAIYSCAVLTIAAADGRHADCGLPGVGIPRRFRQKKEQVAGLAMAIPLPRFDEVNAGNNLMWNERGWTFQEKLLSKRLLIFTHHQVYFKCSNAIWAEDTAMEAEFHIRNSGRDADLYRWGGHKIPNILSASDYTPVDFLTFGSLSLRKRTGNLGLLPMYTAVIEEYTKRKLSFPRDALPAIDGVLRLLDPSSSAYIGGLPASYFHQALLWQPAVGHECYSFEESRVVVPSWSWAHWSLSRGCTWYHEDLQTTTWHSYSAVLCWDSRSGDPLVVSKGPSTSSNIPVSSTLKPKMEKRRTQFSEFLLGFQTVVREFYLGSRLYSGATPSIRQKVGYDGGSWDGGAFGPHALDAAFGRDDKHQLPDPDENAVSVYKLMDWLGVCVGEIWATERIAKMEGPHSFIEISQGKAFRHVAGSISKHLIPTTTVVEKEVVKDNEGNVLSTKMVPKTAQHEETTWDVVNVMMVRWVEGVAYRVALGKVISTAWGRGFGQRWVYLG